MKNWKFYTVPCMSFIASYLVQAISLKASDIHIYAKTPVRVRVNDSIIILDDNIPDVEKIKDELLSFIDEQSSDFLKKDFAELKDICFSFEDLSHNVRMRVTIYRDENGICIAIRIIPSIPLSPDKLGIPEAVIEVCKMNRGLFIVTGASGSGKSTTLASMLQLINSTRKLHIITVEDPIEYIIKPNKSLINHREVGRHTQSFETGLHWALRENPNIVVIGELRNVESMRAAIKIAETGHLVLTTLHTRGAVSTIDRLIGSFQSEEQQQIRMMLADNLIGVLAQTLMPRANGGMIAAFELLLNNDAMKNNIREQKIYQLENILQTGQKQGMISMEDYIIELIRQGLVTYDIAMEKAPNKQKLLEKYERIFGKR